MAETFTHSSKIPFTIEETELYELAELAGIIMDPRVFKISLDMLKMNVTPNNLCQVLKSMCRQALRKQQQQEIQRTAASAASDRRKQAVSSRKEQVSSSRKGGVKESSNPRST